MQKYNAIFILMLHLMIHLNLLQYNLLLLILSSSCCLFLPSSFSYLFLLLLLFLSFFPSCFHVLNLPILLLFNSFSTLTYFLRCFCFLLSLFLINMFSFIWVINEWVTDVLRETIMTYCSVWRRSHAGCDKI